MEEQVNKVPSDEEISEALSARLGEFMVTAAKDGSPPQYVDAMRMIAPKLPEYTIEGCQILLNHTSMTLQQATSTIVAAAVAGAAALRDGMEKEGWKPTW